MMPMHDRDRLYPYTVKAWKDNGAERLLYLLALHVYHSMDGLVPSTYDNFDHKAAQVIVSPVFPWQMGKKELTGSTFISGRC